MDIQWLDVFAVWLLVRPCDLIGQRKVYGILPGDWDRFFARLFGVILLWVQIARWDGRDGAVYVGDILGRRVQKFVPGK